MHMLARHGATGRPGAAYAARVRECHEHSDLLIARGHAQAERSNAVIAQAHDHAAGLALLLGRREDAVRHEQSAVRYRSLLID